MATKTISDNPTIADDVLFDISTPDAEGCFVADPYRVDTVRIYFVDRDTVNGSPSAYEVLTSDNSIQADLDTTRTAACLSPTVENLEKVSRLEEKLSLSQRAETLYFNEARCVASFGTAETPAWLSSDTGNALINHVTEDDDGNTLHGRFQLQWTPSGVREGDYFICWTWTPLPAGGKMASKQHFYLHASTQLTTSIPSHFTNPQKYEVLLDRYLPEMFKMTLCPGDMSPEVIKGWDGAVAKVFTGLEDMANQMVDLLDANAVHESMLQLLANTLGLKLRSSDPTLWRRQIKRAIPLAKKKGTMDGLVEALAQADIKLSKFTRLWQVISKYTWQEAFEVEVDSTLAFELAKVPLLPTDADNFELYVRRNDSDVWNEISFDHVEFDTSSSPSTMTWIGDTLGTPMSLEVGDWVRVVYKVAEPPDEYEQTVEAYIRTLELIDLRDERLQKYPLKNWNVRAIAEDDAIFNDIVKSKHPFHDWIVFGKVRTEFPYSENVYNMEEYNGSKRESKNPCDIDRDFLDPCSDGISSSYSLDLEIGGLSNSRITEALDIVREFTPFHARLHTVNLFGGMEEFVEPPVESVEMLVQYRRDEVTLTNVQTIFNRFMENDKTLVRNLQDGTPALTDVEVVFSNGSGVFKNKQVSLYSHDVDFSKLPLETIPDRTHLKIYAPSSSAGHYFVLNPNGNYVEVQYGNTENHSGFTFDLYDLAANMTSSVATIYQDDVFLFSASGLDWSALGVKSQWDVVNDSSYTGAAWKISFGSNNYDILEILPDGNLSLKNEPSHPLATTNGTGITFSLKNASLTVIASASNGVRKVNRRGRVNLGIGTSLIHINDLVVQLSTVTDIKNIISGDSYFSNTAPTMNPFKIIGFVEGSNQFYIDGWTAGTTSGSAALIWRKVVNQATGYLYFDGITLTVPGDMSASLGIVNGSNPVDPDLLVIGDKDNFKESYLVTVTQDSTTYYYAITDMSYADGATTLTLAGPKLSFGTSGTTKTFSLLHYVKKPVHIDARSWPTTPEAYFDYIDRSGNTDVIDLNIQEQADIPLMSVLPMMNMAKKDQAVDIQGQEESITFTIERKNEG